MEKTWNWISGFEIGKERVITVQVFKFVELDDSLEYKDERNIEMCRSLNHCVTTANKLKRLDTETAMHLQPHSLYFH